MRTSKSKSPTYHRLKAESGCRYMCALTRTFCQGQGALAAPHKWLVETQNRSAYTTHIQDAEAGTASRAGRTAGQPSVRALGILAAGKPLAHASETPHGTAITLLALAHCWLLASLHQLHTGPCLHAAYTGLKLLQRGS